MCDRWLNSFDNFIADMGYRPSRFHSIERIDNDGDYEPNNCQWVTRPVQARNKRSNIWIEYNGVKMILSDWANKMMVAQPAFYVKYKKVGGAETVKYYEQKIKRKQNDNTNTIETIGSKV